MTETYTVTLVPVDVEFEVEDGETVLDAAFRQGIALPHGCKEGQCSACKSILLDGDIELKKYSTFALSEGERDTDHISPVPNAGGQRRRNRIAQLRRRASL